MTFDTAEQSPRYTELMAFTPDMSGHTTGAIVVLTFLALFSGVTGVMTFFFLVTGPGALCPLLMSLLGAGLFVKVLSGLMKFRAAPLERLLAVVKDETTEVDVSTTGTGRNRRTSVTNRHYLLLDTRDGKRESYQCDGDTARRVVKGDIGVAYVRGGVLVDFQPITSPAA